MLDERSLALLDFINYACDDSGYKIFELKELSTSLSPRFLIDIDGVRECVKNLSFHEYISVKYEDEKEICVKPLSKGRLAFENRIEREIFERKEKRLYFLYSALGGAVGGVLASILTLIILLALRGT